MLGAEVDILASACSTLRTHWCKSHSCTHTSGWRPLLKMHTRMRTHESMHA